MRTLALNLGNTSLFAAVFVDETCVRSFRLERDNFAGLPRRVRGAIDRVTLCSVVPARTRGLLQLVRRTWKIEARVLTADQPHGIDIRYRRPRELGTDRLAAAIGARRLLPGRNVVIVDCGTATTVTALRRDGALLGGAILPGFSLWPELLATRTALLPRVPARRPRSALGRSPREAIASGIFFGHVGAIRETVDRVRREAFGRAAAIVIGTGGHAPQFAHETLFARVVPELVLVGLNEFARATTSAPDHSLTLAATKRGASGRPRGRVSS